MIDNNEEISHIGRHDSINSSWLATFADLTSLMLTFFVLMFAASSANQDNWEKIYNSFNNVETLIPENEISENTKKSIELGISSREIEDIQYLYKIIKQKSDHNKEIGFVLVTKDPENLYLSIPKSLLNQENSQKNEEGIIELLGNFLNSFGNKVKIVLNQSTNHDNLGVMLSEALNIAAQLKNAGYVYNIDIVKNYIYYEGEVPDSNESSFLDIVICNYLADEIV